MRTGNRRVPRGDERGFVLVETLVAAAIIAGMMAMLYDTIVADAHVTQALRERRLATMLAQSALSVATSPAAVLPSAGRGRWGGLVWQVARTSYAGGARDSGPPLEHVTVRVRDEASNRTLVMLETLRLAR